MSKLGLVCIQWILWIISFSLLMLREALNLIDLSCNLFGFVVFEWYEMKGITVCSLPMLLNQLYNFWKRKNKFAFFRGWKQKIFVFLLVIICVGNNLSSVWPLVDCFFFFVFIKNSLLYFGLLFYAHLVIKSRSFLW